MDVSYALIADIVGSRRLSDRAGAQRVFLETLSRAGQGLPLTQTPYATVGDEFQMVASTLAGALTLTLRTGLLLPEGLGLRFGIGVGTLEPVSAGESSQGGIQDGSAWWSAREAIDHAHALEDDGRAFCRTWLSTFAQEGTDRAESGPEPSAPSEGGPTPQYESLVNSLLLLRDHAVARLQPRQRRMMAALLEGATQIEVARAEKVSQQAVSEFSRGAGAALLEAQGLLGGFLENRSPREGRSTAKRDEEQNR